MIKRKNIKLAKVKSLYSICVILVFFVPHVAYNHFFALNKNSPEFMTESFLFFFSFLFFILFKL
ncbi:hypothetical protein PPACK8108_LOCUS17724 [Phakopsora pachyrhizi]|uniref:Uncharacterized protein n=1 Tax=Phakopsora pachyrhizi TaxID=170000 RepID=A0AAV0BBC3_PHAPC|nr:hypothetical protein PPACK8108_LOCUS17724 [Phakopsora pachyrhizi]